MGNENPRDPGVPYNKVRLYFLVWREGNKGRYDTSMFLFFLPESPWDITAPLQLHNLLVKNPRDGIIALCIDSRAIRWQGPFFVPEFPSAASIPVPYQLRAAPQLEAFCRLGTPWSLLTPPRHPLFIHNTVSIVDIADMETPYRSVQRVTMLVRPSQSWALCMGIDN